MNEALPRAIAVPFHFTPTGQIGWTDNVSAQARDAILSVVGTIRGERVMRPRYGTEVIEFLFEPLTSETLERLEADIKEAVAPNVPEVTVQAAELIPTQERGIVEITVRFSLANNRVEESVTVDLALPNE